MEIIVRIFVTDPLGHIESDAIEGLQHLLERDRLAITHVWTGIDHSIQTAAWVFKNENTQKPEFTNHTELGCGKELSNDVLIANAEKIKHTVFNFFKAYPEAYLGLFMSEMLAVKFAAAWPENTIEPIQKGKSFLLVYRSSVQVPVKLIED